MLTCPLGAGSFPAHADAKHGNLESVKLLLGIGIYPKNREFADPNNAETETGLAAIHCASQNGRLDIVRTLVTGASADPDIEDALRRCPSVAFACEMGHLSIVRFLLEEVRAGIAFFVVALGLGLAPRFLVLVLVLHIVLLVPLVPLAYLVGIV